MISEQNRFYKGSPKHPFAGGPHIMGIVNVTPDSFSDGGDFLNPDKAIEHGLSLVQAGATILDVGGESTRPGAQAVDVDEEIRRVVPVIAGLRGRVPWLSVDTRNAKTMQAALVAGANSINDVSALSHDSQSVFVASEAKIPVFFMHSQGAPDVMQKNPKYNNAIEDVFDYLSQRIYFFDANRIDTNMLICDPGIGFGKTLEDNCLIIRNIKRFHDLGVPVLLGTSRKSFIAGLSQGEPPDERISGSIASALWGLSQGVQVFRVHDVKETVQAFKVFKALSSDS
jgi:dihydropteroate synthase